MKHMLDHVDSPYIRCIGFLYLRYACEPRMLWGWVEPYLYDEEPVRVEANQAKPETTVGEFVRSLLTDMNYHGTLLPRLPVNIEREIKVKLLQAKQNEDRAKHHTQNDRTMQYFQTLGSRVRALYGDDENPVTWYDAIVDRVISKDEAGAPLLRPRFVVTFPEYGNTETVGLGEMDMPEGAAGDGPVLYRDRPEGRGDGTGHERRGSAYDRYDNRHSHHGDEPEGGRGYVKRHGSVRYEQGRPRDWWDRGSYRGRERSRDRDSKLTATEKDLMEQVIHQDRERILAKGRSYVSRPPTLKASLSSAGGGPRITHSTHPPDERVRGQPDGRLSSSDVNEKKPDAAPKRKTAEEIAAVQEKKRRLMAQYG